MFTILSTTGAALGAPPLQPAGQPTAAQRDHPVQAQGQPAIHPEHAAPNWQAPGLFPQRQEPNFPHRQDPVPLREQNRHSLVPEGIWMPLGITLGGAFRDELPHGFVLGGELSIVKLWETPATKFMWAGGVADVAWDFGNDALRHRAGAELGLSIFGLEAAYLGQWREADSYRPGINLRLVASMPFISVYAGYGHLFGDGPDPHFAEAGALLKVPTPIYKTPRPPR